MSLSFQVRKAYALPKVITDTYTDADAKNLKFQLARSPMCPTNLHDSNAWPEIPKDLDRTDSGRTISHEQRMAYAFDTINNFLSPALLQKIISEIQNDITQHPEKTKIKLVYPACIGSDGSNNLLPAAFAVVAQKKLSGIFKIPVEIDIENNSRNNTIHIVTKGKRGNRAKGLAGQREDFSDTLGRRIAHQNVFAGNVDPDALYVILDDKISLGATIKNLYDYIEGNGGKVAAIATLRKTSPESDILNTTEASIDLLKLILSPPDQQKLNAILNQLGITVDFEHASQSTITNGEALLLGAFLMNKDNPEQSSAMEKALTAAGGCMDAKPPSIIIKVMQNLHGNLDDLQHIISTSLTGRRNVIQGFSREEIKI